MKSSISKLVTLISATLALCMCEGVSLAVPSYSAFSYYGPTTSGGLAGGYYLLDLSRLPTSTHDFIGGPYSLTYRQFLPGAVDDSLLDQTPPKYTSSYNEVYLITVVDPNSGTAQSSGYVAVGNSGGTPPCAGIYYDSGDAALKTDTLGQAIDGLRLSDQSNFVSASNHQPLSSVSVSPFTWNDIVSHPKTFRKPEATHGGYAMEAKFSPTVKIGGADFPVNLEAAAKLFGVDHFNWKQTITDPAAWKVDVWDVDSQINLVAKVGPAPKPRIDLIDSPNRRYVITNELNDLSLVSYRSKGKDGIIRNVVPDSLPYYFNEDCTTNPSCFSFDRREHIKDSGTTFEFSDVPSSEKGFNPNMYYRQFETELVGVMPDGSESQTKTGIKFRWKSNTVTEGGGGVTLDGSLDINLLPPIVGGGVFDVENLSVPEPSTLLLFAIGAISLLGYRRSKSHG